eukprot:jgi/Botrbrau1/1262/Bobra.0163s0055.1
MSISEATMMTSRECLGCQTVSTPLTLRRTQFRVGVRSLPGRDQQTFVRRSPYRRRNCLLQNALQIGQPETSSAGDNEEDQPPKGCARYNVTLSKPLGLILEETRNGGIVVAEISEGGNAAREGQIQVGDELIATSGITYTTEQTYGETNVKGGEQVIRLLCRGEDFKTVMAAISSHPAHIKVRLEFQRCDPSA